MLGYCGRRVFESCDSYDSFNHHSVPCCRMKNWPSNFGCDFFSQSSIFGTNVFFPRLSCLPRPRTITMNFIWPNQTCREKKDEEKHETNDGNCTKMYMALESLITFVVLTILHNGRAESPFKMLNALDILFWNVFCSNAIFRRFNYVHQILALSVSVP